jgi:hypothetical protein
MTYGSSDEVPGPARIAVERRLDLVRHGQEVAHVEQVEARVPRTGSESG